MIDLLTNRENFTKLSLKKYHKSIHKVKTQQDLQNNLSIKVVTDIFFSSASL